MLRDAFLVVSLAALAAFILWEGWQRGRGKPLDRAAMERGVVPGATAAEQMLLIWAAVLAAFSGMLFVSPPHPPFTGRGAAIGSLVYAVLGPLGIPMAIAGAAAACFAAGLSRRRSRLGAKRER